MILPVLQFPDPRLRKQSLPIGEIGPEIRQLAEDMLETMYARDGIGLAAPQVGQTIRLITVDVTGPDRREEPMVLVNPVLAPHGPEVETEEGCLSVPDLRSTVARSSGVRLSATGLDGEPVLLEADGLLAICLQHECDHLDGTLFIDHISRLKRSMYERKMKKNR